ncbi:MAG: protein kinase [Gemmataceae bacterium]|nr:protein kinase [Gemmataceae bacterium]
MPVRLANQTEPIPGYRLMERLGRGGFGEVWKCEAPGGLLKAIKFVYGEIEGGKGSAGAEQELKALNRVKTVRHPYILSLERVDIIDGQLLIVMELADRSVMDRYNECRGQGLPGIPREELIGYMEESAEALDLMNLEYQLQHLDIKPQNLFLVRNHIKVADFGLCKDLQDFKASVTGGVTPLYAAPETFEGWVSRFCDQYSLAIVYQELLTGVRPFDGTNARQLLMQHVQMPPDLTALPEGDRDAIGRALSKKPNDRFPSCLEMVKHLRGAGSVGTPMAPPERAPSTMQNIELPPLVGETSQPADEATARPGSKSSQAITKNFAAPAKPAVKNEIKKTRPSAQGISQTPRPLVDPGQQAPLTPESDTRQAAMRLSAPVEFKGEGVLMPALVIGIGELGLGVVQRLRQALTERYGPLEEMLPHLRMLYIDTDPDGIGAALRGSAGSMLEPREVMLTRLNRPSHYMKPRDVNTGGGKPLISTWLDPKMLYRIPRGQTTANVRGLGRLALVDNQRDLLERLRTDLLLCTETEALATADRHTRLGLRTNRPRVFVIAGLGGGTGSGMFLDIAYLARAALKNLGYQQPDLVGLFFLPTADPQRAHQGMLGNTYAALTELNHFSSPGVIFTARYAEKQAPITDGDPPFGHCVLLPQATDEDTPRELVGTAAGYLYRDLMSPLGRASDAQRAEAFPDSVAPRPGIKTPPLCHTLGMYRLHWPRRVLVERMARLLGKRLVEHWIAKNASHLQKTVETWVKDQWAKRQLQVDHLISCLRAGAEGSLDAEPEEAFAKVMEPLTKLDLPPGAPVDPVLARKILDELVGLVGRVDQPAHVRTAVLVEGLDAAAKSLLVNCEQKLAEMAVHLVEQPQFRFAGADEAIRQISVLIDATIEQQELLAQEFTAKAQEAYTRLLALMDFHKANASSKRKVAAPPGPDVVDLLRLYPNYRFKALMLTHVLTVYRSLRGNCPEYAREFTYCRARLADLIKAFDKPPPSTLTPLDLGPNRQLLPAGCRTLDDTLAKVMADITAQDVLELDKKVQATIQRNLKAMVHICTTPATNILREVEMMLTLEMESFAKVRLGGSNALETFLGQYPRDEVAQNQLANAFEEAVPQLDARNLSSRPHSAIVLVPSDPEAERFTLLVQQAIADAHVFPCDRADDVVFYREAAGVKLADLPQMGATGKAAYDKMASTDHFTPHSRIDVEQWRPVG